jgi:hypothetical protein
MIYKIFLKHVIFNNFILILVPFEWKEETLFRTVPTDATTRGCDVIINQSVRSFPHGVIHHHL